MTDKTAQDVLNFWTEAGPKKWWKKDPGFDAEILQQFGDLYQQACAGELDGWADNADGALALILLLDQFSRNLHRNSPLSFAQDAKCADLTRAVIASGADHHMPADIRPFCYMPLMHSESLEDQKLGLEMMEKFGVEGNVKAAVEHRDIIVKFGRFPHRNSVLGRQTTPEEQTFLDDGGFAG